MKKMIAIQDRPENPFVTNKIYEGDICKVWKDDDFSNLYFVQSVRGQVIELDSTQIIEMFGKLP